VVTERHNHMTGWTPRTVAQETTCRSAARLRASTPQGNPRTWYRSLICGWFGRDKLCRTWYVGLEGRQAPSSRKLCKEQGTLSCVRCCCVSRSSVQLVFPAVPPSRSFCKLFRSSYALGPCGKV
jgi:hypothetical protein